MPKHLKDSEELGAWFASKIWPDGSSDCLLWLGDRNHKWYGRIKILGTNVSAHRLSFELFVDFIPNGLQVLHKCDNRCCVNPDHLFLGTNADNNRDAALKDRRRQKLSIDQVRQIRRMDGSQRCIARLFGIAQSQVSKIKLYQRRQHVT